MEDGKLEGSILVFIILPKVWYTRLSKTLLILYRACNNEFMITFLMIIMAKDSLLNLVLLVNLHISSLIYLKYSSVLFCLW